MVAETPAFDNSREARATAIDRVLVAMARERVPAEMRQFPIFEGFAAMFDEVTRRLNVMHPGVFQSGPALIGEIMARIVSREW